MSRTYRKIPHFVSKRDLVNDFHDLSFYYGRTRLRNATTEKKFVKIAMARYRSDAMRRDGLSDTFRMTANGKPLGYTEWSRSDGWAKRYANKVRRNGDKAIVAEAFDELIEAHDAAIKEMAELSAQFEDDYSYEYEEYLRDQDCEDRMRDYIEPNDWCDPYEMYPDDWYDPPEWRM